MTEPTQEEIDGVAAVFAEVADDPIAQGSAYIMAKKLKRVFCSDDALAAERDAGWNEALMKAGAAIIELRGKGFGNMLDALASLKRPVTP